MRYFDEQHNEKLKNNLGENIRKYRKLRGMTQKELAEKINKSESAVRNYELGNRMPDLNTLDLISIHLGIRSDYFYSPNPEDRSSAFNMLVRFESLYGLVPKMIDGDLHFVFLPPSEDGSIESPTDKYILKEELLRWCQVRDSYKAGEHTKEEYEEWKLSDGVLENVFSDYEGYPLSLEEEIANETARRECGFFPSPVYDEKGNLVMPVPDDANELPSYFEDLPVSEALDKFFKERDAKKQAAEKKHKSNK
ncbi:helix-turn-helix domain-containing protein [Sharpea azabuensis]|uniref:helix-turn-helix domain-containing protein n=1 Tax=Sharpea azabuensis TaxID=322505 RepID=UPI00156563AD|nr:helix-turn-helix transcriptional regulator [Sharpea azabuensis]